MSDLLIYCLVASIVLLPLVALVFMFRGAREATPDDLPAGDCSHHPDSIRDAQKANGRAPDA
jgi:hypothetical protein